jgi:hypothetical protein
LLAEFALGLTRTAPERERGAARELTDLLLEHVILGGDAVGFAALENTTVGDRVIGACAVAAGGEGNAEFRVAVAESHRGEQIGRIGIHRLGGDMHWSNRPMQMLALSMGFVFEPVPRDRNLRRVVLALK